MDPLSPPIHSLIPSGVFVFSVLVHLAGNTIGIFIPQNVTVDLWCAYIKLDFWCVCVCVCRICLRRSYRHLEWSWASKATHKEGWQTADSGAGQSESPEEEALGLLREGFQKSWGWRVWTKTKHRLGVAIEHCTLGAVRSLPC